jgi:hypothetical protein
MSNLPVVIQQFYSFNHFHRRYAILFIVYIIILLFVYLGDGPDMVGEAKKLEDCANSMDSFSGFLDPGGRFTDANKSVHYHHWLGFSLADGFSCHGRVEQVTHHKPSNI